MKKYQKEFVLIDDDELIQLLWRLSAQDFQVKFFGFTSGSMFFKKSSQFERDTPIYIDFKFENSFCGDRVAQKVYQLGFKKIYIATGCLNIDLSHLFFIKGLVGKDPAWLEKKSSLRGFI